MAEPIVVVGGGLAASGTVKTLREEGYDGEVVVATAEAHRPYERPPLSKDYLRGETDRTALFPLEESWFDAHGVELRTGATAVGLDVAAHHVTFADASRLGYSSLVIATGASPNAVGVPGADLRGVLSLRTVESAELLAAALHDAIEGAAREGSATSAGTGRLVVIGDSWIGMEVAASARTMGLAVDVVGRGAHPLSKLGPEMGAVYGALHEEHGVTLHPNGRVQQIEGEKGRVTGVLLADGTRLPAEVVLAGVGVSPNLGLAAAAGLTLRDDPLGGIAVDGTLRTSAPDVFAVGDVASIPSPVYDRALRIEHWQIALDTGPHAARAILGSGAAYDKLPYFFSDQYDAGMEYTGFVAGPDGYDDVVVSGSLEAREFVAFWQKGGAVQAGMAMNVWDRMPDVEALIRSREATPRAVLERFIP